MERPPTETMRWRASLDPIQQPIGGEYGPAVGSYDGWYAAWHAANSLFTKAAHDWKEHGIVGIGKEW